MIMKLMNKDAGEGGGAGEEGAENNNAAGAEGGENGADGGEEGGEDSSEMQFFEDEDNGGEEGAAGEGDDKKKDKGAAPTKTVSDYSRYRELLEGDEDLDEEKVYTKVQSLKNERDNLRILAQGREAIEQDKDIKTYRNLLTASNENLAFLTLVQDYIDSDVPEAQAKQKATADMEKIKAKEGGDDEIEKIAMGTKKILKANIKEGEAAILEKIKNAQKSVDLRPSDNKVTEKSKSEVATLDSFIGFKLPKDHKAKIVKAAQDYIGSEQERKDLNDPKIRGKIAMFLANEKQWQKNVEARSRGTKAELIKRAIAQPKIGKGKAAVKPVVRGEGQGSGRVMKNPGAFLGAKK
jgi:hypothetical protein